MSPTSKEACSGLPTWQHQQRAQGAPRPLPGAWTESRDEQGLGPGQGGHCLCSGKAGQGLQLGGKALLSHLHSAALGKDGVPRLPGASRAFLRCAGAESRPGTLTRSPTPTPAGPASPWSGPCAECPAQSAGGTPSPGPRAPRGRGSRGRPPGAGRRSPNSGPGENQGLPAPHPPLPLARAGTHGSIAAARPSAPGGLGALTAAAAAGAGETAAGGAPAPGDSPERDARPGHVRGSGSPRGGAAPGEEEGVQGWGRDRGPGRGAGLGRGRGPVEGWAALACLASRPLGRAPAARPPPLSPSSAEAGPWVEGVEGGVRHGFTME